MTVATNLGDVVYVLSYLASTMVTPEDRSAVEKLQARASCHWAVPLSTP